MATARPQLNRHGQEASGSSPWTTIFLSALKSHPPGQGGVSVATRCEVRLRRSDGARASRRGCFGSRRSPSFPDLAVGKLPDPALPSPSLPFPSLSLPGFSLLPFTCLSLIACRPGAEPSSGPGARKRAAPGARYMTRRPAAPCFLRPMWLRGHGGAAHYGPESS